VWNDHVGAVYTSFSPATPATRSLIPRETPQNVAGDVAGAVAGNAENGPPPATRPATKPAEKPQDPADVAVVAGDLRG
jgi:hypothetical protein